LDVTCFRLPADFWKILHAEYGIVVYPSALTENIAAVGVGAAQTFSEVYSSHIGKEIVSQSHISELMR
jgi:hypothetical protein